MADKNWPGRSHAPETDNEDPFAELTRIMGFDPREPVAAKRQAEAGSFDEENDPGIDLEKELMADLDPVEDELHFPAALSASANPGEAGSYTEDFYGASAAPRSQWNDDALSNAFNDVFQPRQAESEPAPLDEPQLDDFHFDLDAALSEELGLPQDEPVAYQDAAQTVEQAAEWPAVSNPSVSTVGVSNEADYALEQTYAEHPSSMIGVTEAEAYTASEWQQPHVAHWSGEVESTPVADDLTEIGLDDFEFTDIDEPVAAHAAHSEADVYASVPQSQWEPQAGGFEAPAAPTVQPASFEDELSAFLSGASDPFAPQAEFAPQLDEQESAETLSPIDDGDSFWRDFQSGVASSQAPLVSEENIPADDFDGFELDFDDVDDLQVAQPVEADQAPVREHAYGYDDGPFSASYAEHSPTDAYSDGNGWQADEPRLEETQEDVDPFAALESLSLEAFEEETDEPRTEAAFAPLTTSQEPVQQPGWTQEDVAEASAQSVRQAVDQSRSDAPDIETIDISESAAPLKDDLDLPEFDFSPEEAQAVEPMDDFESELSGAFGAPLRPQQPAQNEPSHVADHNDDFDNEWERDLNAAIVGAGLSIAGTPARAQSYAGESEPMQHQYDEADDAPDYASHGSSYQPVRQQIAHTQPPLWRRHSRGLIAGVAALVLLGGGAVAWGTWSGGDMGADGDPVVISADDRPVRMRPEAGDGAEETADNKVFQTMAGNQGTSGQQETLAGGAEQPVDITAMRQNENNLPGVDTPALAPGIEGEKIEDRIAATQSDAEQVASDVSSVTPRRVRTLVVRPDGSLAPREDPTPAPIQSQAQAGNSDAQQELVVAMQNGQPEPSQAVTTTSITPPGGSQMPSSGPAVPSRPSDQPVTVTGQTGQQTQQIAAAPTQAATPPATPAPTAAPAGEWSIQIASQPSREAAQSSYNSLSQRYSSVLGARSYNIVSAEIEGRGTFYRVRVAGGTREQAIQLCEQYKSAGGSCFVSR